MNDKMIKSENISLEKFLTDQNIEFKNEYLANDFMVIPNSTMTIEDVSLIKEIRENNKVTILNNEKIAYQDFRGGEYEIITFLVREIALPILLGCISGLIIYKIKSHEKGKQKSGAEKIKMPRFRIDIHRTEKDEHITMEGEADDVLKSLKELKDDKNPS